MKLKSSSENQLRTNQDEERLQDQINTLLKEVKGKTSRLYPSFNMAEITLQEEADVLNVIKILMKKDEVVHAEPNYIVEKADIPDDPGYDSLWGMDKIDAPGAWDVTNGSNEVVVPVIDSGIDYTHPDLKDNMWTSENGNHGYNAVNDSNDPMDNSGHGTHVAGTIGAVGNNGEGVAGINWNVSLMGVKVLDSEGNGNVGDVISGLEYILNRSKDGENIFVTSNSWWGPSRSELLYDAIKEHLEEGILFISAAGNEELNNGKAPSYPANYDLPNIISVAATDQDDKLADFSNYGKRSVHVGAPGIDINSTKLDGGYSSKKGTSMSVPHVSGLAALLASHNSSYDYYNLKNIILSSADSSSTLKGKNLVDGRINASSSLKQSPDPDDIRFWVHKPYISTQWREKTKIMISLNDGVNPIREADVRVEFSTDKGAVELVDDGSGSDHIEDDGYYTTGWTPKESDEVTLNITVQSEELDENLTKNVTVDVKLIHRETAQSIVRTILTVLVKIAKAIGGLLTISLNVTNSSTAQYHPVSEVEKGRCK
ncbi:MAG: S8 family peptidase [Candidatus Thermoplasmatota archaeon]